MKARLAMNLLPLFLVSLAAVGYETALTRYFAVAKWSEYGYWVISIVMVGFALSGVVLALWRDVFRKARGSLMACAAGGAGADRGGRLPLHDDQSVQPAAIAESRDMAAADLEHRADTMRRCCRSFSWPGLFISLSFVRNADRIGRVYAFDLTGAGAGAAGVLAAMYAVHAFDLVPLLLVPLALAAVFISGRLPPAGDRGGGPGARGRRGGAAAGQTRRLIMISRRYMRHFIRRMPKSSHR